MAFVYILQTQNGQYYVGSTDNIERRLKQRYLKHTATTSRLGVEKVLLTQEYKTLAEARKVELKIKKLKRKDYIEKMVKAGYIKILP
jgi:predicted GIY-YIG superfamily endonuclease